MATKFTVALVGGIVMVLSIAILIIETLMSPSLCMASGETSQTEGTLLQKTEPVSSPSTILSPTTDFPPHSTNLPSLGETSAENSTPQLGTVLSTVNVVDTEETSPSTAEEASDRQPTDDGTVTVTLPASVYTTIDSGETGYTIRNIIIVPTRKCPNGGRRDKFGVCRQKW